MGFSQSEHPKVFISYSHDSSEHQDIVLKLADHLRQEGIDTLLDQYEPAPPDGWPMWMDREIQKADFVVMVCTETYLRRVEGRENPGKGRGVLWEVKLFYNSLYEKDTNVQRFIPILLKGGDPSHIPSPLRTLAYYRVDTEEGYESLYRHLTGQLGRERAPLGRLIALPAITPQSYPASLNIRAEVNPPSSFDRRNRLQILKRVRLDWIDGVLNSSLYKIARIELGLEARADAVEQPLNAIIQLPDEPPKTLPAGTILSQIFDEYGGALLILGAPGTGKTTLLLELAQDLLDRAEKDESHPIPVVFNLSSWAVRRQSLDKWLVAELNYRSDVPKGLAQHLVETEQVLPLLDGLDEVALTHREACVDAINNFRRGHGLLPIAVCSRIHDYEALGKKLRLRSAVVVQPLTPHQVEDYLDRIGDPVRTHCAALKNDVSLGKLLETPLMLWVATLAYRDAPAEFAQEDTIEQRHRRLFANFVDAMFRRRSEDKRYTQTQAVSWLSHLASTLTRDNQTVFHLEDLQGGWLPTPTRNERWLLTLGVAVATGMASGLIVGLNQLIVWILMSKELISGLISGLNSGLIINVLGSGLVFGLIAALMRLRPVDTMRFSPADMPSRIPKAIRYGLLVGLIVGLIAGLIHGVFEPPYDMFAEEFHFTRLLVSIGSRFVAGLIYGLIAGLSSGLIVALMRLWPVHTMRFSPADMPSRIPKAIRYGLQVGLLVGLFVGPIFCIIGERFNWLIHYLIISQVFKLVAGGLPVGLIVGLMAGLTIGLISGLTKVLYAEAVEIRISPNQGTHRSLSMALSAWLIAWLITVLMHVQSLGWVEGLSFGMISGLSYGLFAGLFAGGLFFLNHFIIRLALRINRLAPFNYVRFLNYSADRLFLYRVGGGYTFVHGLLREHFSSLAAKSFK
jgi:eukaryotic-like serine/threonine-protein kinase